MKDAFTMDDMIEAMETAGALRPKGPRIDDDTLMWANLATHAMNGEQLAQVEAKTGKDILWIEALEFGGKRDDNDGALCIFNPTRPEPLSPPLLVPWLDYRPSVLGIPVLAGLLSPPLFQANTAGVVID